MVINSNRGKNNAVLTGLLIFVGCTCFEVSGAKFQPSRLVEKKRYGVALEPIICYEAFRGSGIDTLDRLKTSYKSDELFLKSVTKDTIIKALNPSAKDYVFEEKVIDLLNKKPELYTLKSNFNSILEEAITSNALKIVTFMAGKNVLNAEELKDAKIAAASMFNGEKMLKYLNSLPTKDQKYLSKVLQESTKNKKTFDLKINFNK